MVTRWRKVRGDRKPELVTLNEQPLTRYLSQAQRDDVTDTCPVDTAPLTSTSGRLHSAKFHSPVYQKFAVFDPKAGTDLEPASASGTGSCQSICYTCRRSLILFRRLRSLIKFTRNVAGFIFFIIEKGRAIS